MVHRSTIKGWHHDYRWHICFWLVDGVCHLRKKTCLFLLFIFFLNVLLPWQHNILWLFSFEMPSGQIRGDYVCDIINNTASMKGSDAIPPHPSVSPLFLLPCYSSMLNTSASAIACVAWIYMNVSPTEDNGGQVIDMCRRTQDKQLAPTGVTPACLIHFDWAKTERWGGGGRPIELGRLKSRDKMTEKELFHLLLQTAT